MHVGEAGWRSRAPMNGIGFRRIRWEDAFIRYWAPIALSNISKVCWKTFSRHPFCRYSSNTSFEEVITSLFSSILHKPFSSYPSLINRNACPGPQSAGEIPKSFCTTLKDHPMRGTSVFPNNPKESGAVSREKLSVATRPGNECMKVMFSFPLVRAIYSNPNVIMVVVWLIAARGPKFPGIWRPISSSCIFCSCPALSTLKTREWVDRRSNGRRLIKRRIRV